MRKKFFDALFELMRKDKNIVFITADLGYGYANKIRDELSDQFFNVGCAEQVMLNIAIGLSLSGKIAVTYTITPFYFRTFEAIRLYVNHEKIPVKLIGAGRGNDYNAGFSHDASDHDILKQFTNIDFIVPENDFNLSEIIYSGRPAYLNLKR